ncbi:hypothetical protein F5Y17DRAFT_474482 [Xylariaceae sp. FL0594]|nr:hypothetical protein F5Y17DRAFT_474482 [Xylariaceae sp. FL0594]
MSSSITGDSLSLEEKLVNIRDFTDFTLVCRGRRFRLHRAVVCAQSSVIATALREGFSDNTHAGFLHVPFDLGSVRRLIEFLYTGDYQLSPDPALRLLEVVDEEGDKAKVGGDNTTETSREDGNDDSNARDYDATGEEEGGGGGRRRKEGEGEGRREEVEAPTSVSDRLKCHSRVDSVANYYDIGALSRLARSKVDDILVREWSADAFCDLVRDSLGSGRNDENENENDDSNNNNNNNDDSEAPSPTSDTEYHRMLAVKAVEHADELLDMLLPPSSSTSSSEQDQGINGKKGEKQKKKNIFDKNGPASALAPHMLPVFLSRLRAAEARIEDAREALAAERGRCKEEHSELLDRAKALDACVRLVNDNPRCRSCGVDFACTLEQTAWFHPRHILRCSRCSCRHEEVI